MSRIDSSGSDTGEGRANGFATALSSASQIEPASGLAPDGLQSAFAGPWDELASAVVLDVCELPDRTSPDDWPEALLVTSEELHTLLTNHLSEHPLVGAAPELLEALERLLGVCEMTTFSDQYPAECENAGAAIARARGDA